MRAAALCAVLVLGAAACAPRVPRRVDFSDTRRNFRPEDYRQVLDAWTRHHKVVRDVGTVIEVWATYKSWEYRQAYIEKYAAVYHLSDEDRAALYETQLEAARRWHELHVVVQTTSHRWNDLEKETSAWRVMLLDGTGAELHPTSIEVPKFPELYESAFFPHRTEFSRTYVIRFDRAEAEEAGFTGAKSGRILFRVASPLGKAEVGWEASGP